MKKRKDTRPKSKSRTKNFPEKEEKVEKQKELEDKLARALADYQNLQKQTVLRIESMRIASINDILLRLVEIYDDLRLAIKSQQNESSGINMILDKIQGIIESQGCNLIIPDMGGQFDSNTMEAIGEVKDDDGERNKDRKKKRNESMIAEVIRCGLGHNDKVIKPAQVILFKKAD